MRYVIQGAATQASTATKCRNAPRHEPREARRIADLQHCRYSVRVRRLVFHRWSVVILVLMRLLFGTSAHAMPYELHATPAHDATSLQNESPCPDHAGATSHTATETAAADDHDLAADGERDCCKSGGCECACATVTVLAASSPRLTIEPSEEVLVSLNAAAVLPDRQTALFRPPA